MTIRDDLMKELEHEIHLLKPHTQAQYRAHIADYLDFVKRRGPTYARWKDRDMVYAFMAKLEKAGKSQSTINFIIRGPIGCLFRFSGLLLPVKLPHVDPAVYGDAEEALFWTEGQVQGMIKTARTGDIQIQAIIAVGTIYAPRLSEVVKINSKCIDLNKMVITIPTVKHNLVRRHLIPEPIQPQLCKYDWPELSEHQLRQLFEELTDKAGIERKPRQSFHAFRHTLWNELSFRGLTDKEIYEFTGWARGSTLGSYIQPLKYNPNNDNKVFGVHPFLEYWK